MKVMIQHESFRKINYLDEFQINGNQYTVTKIINRTEYYTTCKGYLVIHSEKEVPSGTSQI